jgi:hypothetical protein
MALHRDFRKLDQTTQAELRRVAVAMVEAGKTRVEAARRSGDAVVEGGRRGPATR